MGLHGITYIYVCMNVYGATHSCMARASFATGKGHMYITRACKTGKVWHNCHVGTICGPLTCVHMVHGRLSTFEDARGNRSVCILQQVRHLWTLLCQATSPVLTYSPQLCNYHMNMIQGLLSSLYVYNRSKQPWKGCNCVSNLVSENYPLSHARDG